VLVLARALALGRPMLMTCRPLMKSWGRCYLSRMTARDAGKIYCGCVEESTTPLLQNEIRPPR
jgi:hypothetical protein